MIDPAVTDASTIYVVDTETTGLEPSCKIVEAARCRLRLGADNRWTRDPAIWSSLVNPLVPIPVGAMACHHITDEMVAEAPEFEGVRPHLDPTVETEDRLPVYAAHNAKFDRQFFDPEGSSWICTYKCALVLFPDAPGFKNHEIRYWLGLKLIPDLCARPHRAPDDCYVTAAILARMLSRHGLTVERAVEISARPAFLPFFAFGKHAMKPVAEVPADYLEWMSGQKDMNEDALHTARAELQRRMEGAR